MGSTNRSTIKVVAPSAAPAVVNLYKADGSSAATAYTTVGGSTTVTFPATVAAGATSTYYVFEDQVYTVSVKVNGVELATAAGEAFVATVSNDGVMIAPTVPASAGVSFGSAQAVNAQTGTSYTLASTDAGKLVTLSNASSITLTLPQDSDATIAVGTYVDLMQLGAGQVTVAAGSGATLRNAAATAKIRAQYARAAVQKVSANTWSLFGDLAAS